MDEKKIVIVIRDLNGKRLSLEFQNVTNFNSFNWDDFDDENYEILLVTWGDFCIYSGLTECNGLCFEDLTGFFG